MTPLYLCAAGNPEAVRLALEINEADRRWDHIVLPGGDPAKLGQNILEVPIVGGFAQVLKLPAVSSETNFFDAGGTSQTVLDLQVALINTLGFPVTIVDLFRFSTSARLAAHLFGADLGQAPPSSKEIINRRRQLRQGRNNTI